MAAQTLLSLFRPPSQELGDTSNAVGHAEGLVQRGPRSHRQIFFALPYLFQVCAEGSPLRQRFDVSQSY